MAVSYILFSYLLGAIPWSVWLGRSFFHLDPREQSADQNPGAANAFKSAGWALGIPVLILDFLKAFIPCLIANYFLTFSPLELFFICLMPTVGHAYSVFLGGRGGRGIVSLFGVWAGISLYQAPLIMGSAALLSLVSTQHDSIRTLAIPLALIGYLLIREAPLWMLMLAISQLIMLILKLAHYHLNTRSHMK